MIAICGSFCRSCGAPVLWAHTPAGRDIPLDREPRQDGNVVLDAALVARVVSTKDPDYLAAIANGDARYVSHFATCPNARRHRRPRAGA